MSDPSRILMNVRFTVQEDTMQTVDQAQHTLEEIARAHQWQRARFTGTVTCAACALLPLDQDDVDSPCPGA